MMIKYTKNPKAKITNINIKAKLQKEKLNEEMKITDKMILNTISY